MRTVSILIPIYNEANFIHQTLDSILVQDYPLKFIQIIIIDGESDDGTLEIIRQYAQSHQNILVMNNPEKIVSTGLNRALSISTGDLIIRVDGHSKIEKKYVSKCVELISQMSEVSCVGGAIKNISTGILGNAINIAQASLFGVGGVKFRGNHHSGKFVDTLAFGAYRRNVFENIGGFDEELVRNQDDEFNFRLLQAGGKIWMDSEIKSCYYPRTSIKKLFRQYFQYGYYKIRVIQKRGGVASLRHMVPGFFIFSLLTSIGIGVYTSDIILMSSILAPYILLNVIATVLTIYYNKISIPEKYSYSLIPLVFLILHLGYGIGFLVGGFIFVFKWGDRLLKDSKFDKVKFMEISENTIS